MKIREEIKYLVRNLPIEDCKKIFIEASHNEILITKKIIEMGIDPLSAQSPFQPIFAGRIYAEEGQEGLKNHDGFSEKGIRDIVELIIETEARIDDALKKSRNQNLGNDSDNISIMFQKINMPKLKRKTFKFVHKL